MKVWKTALLAGVIVVAVGAGAALAPVAKGQTWMEDFGDGVAQAVQIAKGGGSYLGVSVRDVDDEDAKRAKLPNTAGVVIEEVRAESPAEKAGLKSGDVVVEFDGERVRSTRQFTRLVQETPPARQVQAVVIRDGQRTTLSVQPRSSADYMRDRSWDRLIAPAPPRPPTPPRAPRAEILPRVDQFFGSSTGRLGLTVEHMSEQLADYFGTKDGVLVTSVADNSAAAKAGLKAGDVLTSINGAVVDTPSELSRRVSRLEDGDELTLEVVRDKKKLTLKGKVEPRQSRRWTARTIL